MIITENEANLPHSQLENPPQRFRGVYDLPPQTNMLKNSIYLHLITFNSHSLTSTFNPDGINIPLKYVLCEGQKGPYESLRQCGLVALFKYLSPDAIIPVYAKKNFEALLTCKVDGEEITMSDNKQVTDVLENACADHLMDDNDGTILEIHCSFANKKCDRVKKIRSSASATAEIVMKTLKNWVEKASIQMNKTVDFKSDKEYVVVDDEKKQKLNSPSDWANRFVHFLFHPEEMQKNTEKYSPGAAIDLKDTLDTFALDVVEGFTRVFDLVDEIITRHEVAHASRCVKKWNAAKLKNEEELPHLDLNLGKGVEIVFDVDGKNAPEEWKILFGNESISLDAVLLEAPIADDVISISSDDDTLGIGNCDVSGSDDDSWTMLADEI